MTVLEMADVPLERALGREMGELYADFHREQGVDLRTGEALERFEGDGRVERVVGTSGTSFECDFVVVGVGIEPNVELAEDAGLAVDNGIVVNEYCQTSDANVFAAGDVANFYHPLLDQRLRVEHWANAQNQGAAAAKNMLGQERAIRRAAVVLVRPVRPQHAARRTRDGVGRSRDARRRDAAARSARSM